jgi:hypothetical protein
MSDENPNQLIQSTTAQDHIESHQHPRQVESFELHPEPERHDLISIELAPDVQDAQHHRLQQEIDLGSKADDLKDHL